MIEITPWEMAQARHIDESAAFAQDDRGGAARPRRADEPARAPAGAVPRARRGEHAGRAGRDGFHLESRRKKQRLAADDHQAALVQALLDGILRYRERRRREPDEPAPTPRDSPRLAVLRDCGGAGSCSSGCRAGTAMRAARPTTAAAATTATPAAAVAQDHRHTLLHRRRRDGARAGAAGGAVRRDRRRAGACDRRSAARRRGAAGIGDSRGRRPA